jgi:CBS domain containing-hemolysin-like protein
MPDGSVPLLIALICLLLLSGFFSATETAFSCSNKIKLRTLATNGNKRAKLVLNLAEDKFDSLITTILIGNNIVNITSATLATIFFSMIIKNGASAEVISTIVTTVAVLIFGEIVPKVVAKEHASSLILWVTMPIHILTLVLYPIVFIVMAVMNLLRKLWGKDSESEPEITEDELSSIIDTVEREGVIDEDQSDLLQSTLEFSDTTIAEVMTPRTELYAVDLDDEIDEIKKVIEESTFSRLPVYRDNIDDILGILSINQYYKEAVDNENVSIEGIMFEPCFLHKTMKLPAALKQLRKKHVHMAVVIDEFGGTLGIVTIEDILEEIVGDIWDETDEIISEITQIDNNKYEVLAETSISDLFYELDFHPKEFECEYSTVGGWAIESLNSEPHEGDTFDFEYLNILVSEMEDDIIVTKLIVTVGERPSEDDEVDE